MNAIGDAVVSLFVVFVVGCSFVAGKRSGEHWLNCVCMRFVFSSKRFV